MRNRNVWRLWAKALGEKASKNDRESDHIAYIRSVIFGTYLITNCFIVAGVIRHWNDSPVILIEYEVQGSVSQTKEKGLLTAGRDFLYD